MVPFAFEVRHLISLRFLWVLSVMGIYQQLSATDVWDHHFGEVLRCWPLLRSASASRFSFWLMSSLISLTYSRYFWCSRSHWIINWWAESRCVLKAPNDRFLDVVIGRVQACPESFKAGG